MVTIKCPSCGTPVQIDIAKAVDELGEVFKCNNCGYLFRYVDK